MKFNNYHFSIKHKKVISVWHNVNIKFSIGLLVLMSSLTLYFKHELHIFFSMYDIFILFCNCVPEYPG